MSARRARMNHATQAGAPSTWNPITLSVKASRRIPGPMIGLRSTIGGIPSGGGIGSGLVRQSDFVAGNSGHRGSIGTPSR